MEEVRALHAAATKLATEAMDLVQQRASSAPHAAVSLAVALGKLCSELDLDPDQMKDCIDIAYQASKETRQAQDLTGEAGSPVSRLMP